MPLLFSVPQKKRPWYLAGNIPSTGVVAAYKFVNQPSRATARLNLPNPNIHILVEHEQNLADPNLKWDATRGFRIATAPETSQGQSTSTFISTDIFPQSENWSIFAKFRYNGLNNANVVLLGTSDGTRTLAFYDNRNPGFNRFTNYNAAYNTNNNDSPYLGVIGTMAITPGHGYRNGIEFGAGFAQSVAGVCSQAIYLLLLNNAGVAANNGVHELHYVSIYSIPLTPSQVLSLHNAVQ